MNFLSLNIRDRVHDLSSPQVMSIINVTPDSFAVSCRNMSEFEVLSAAEQAVAEGAAILDIGGQSSRPGAEIVSEEEEWRRVALALRAIRARDTQTLISVDTFRAEVARRAVFEGADIINDISGGDLDPQMWEVVSRARVPYILMHMRGTPATMSSLTDYDDILSEICACFAQRVDALHKMGVRDIILDPGYGFAKTLEQNYHLLRPESLRTIGDMFGLPILVGVSRKSMLCRVLGCTPAEALNATTAAHMVALMGGANILRVHDTRQAVEAVKIYNQLKQI